MRFVSCFSGIEAASAAWLPLGWECAGVAEVEPFPCAVLAHHYPDVPNLGDVLAPDFLQRVSALRPDVLVGGPPCQDFSVAGLRAGVSGDRGNLSLRWVEIVRAIRPNYAVTENVPGWLSVNDGHAFGAFLAGLVGHDTALVPPRSCGGRWTNAGMVAGPDGRVAWRVLDAQFFGLAQRRQRVFAVYCPRDGADPAAVLLESARLCRDPAPRREAGEGTPSGPGVCAAVSSGRGWWDDSDVGATIRVSDSVTKADTLIAQPLVAGTIEATLGRSRGAGTPPGAVVATPLQEIGKRTGVSTDDPRAGIGIGEPGDPMFTLQAGAQHGVLAFPANLSGTQYASAEDLAPSMGAKNPTAVAFQTRIARNGRGYSEDVLPALSGADAGATSDMRPCVAIAFAENSRAELRIEGGDGNTVASLKTGGGKPGQSYPAVMQAAMALCEGAHGTTEMAITTSLQSAGGKPGQGYQAVRQGAAVRRLTPTECCRLMGFSDDYLDITFRGRPAADGNKYRALGNSMAVPCMAWIGSRIAAHEAELKSHRRTEAA